MNPDPQKRSDSPSTSTGHPPRWNIVSVALPGIALAIGLIAMAANPSGRGDYAGALGGAVLLVFGMGAACLLGGLAAVIALARGERLSWLTALGLVVNGVVVIPVFGLLLLV